MITWGMKKRNTVMGLTIALLVYPSAIAALADELGNPTLPPGEQVATDDGVPVGACFERPARVPNEQIEEFLENSELLLEDSTAPLSVETRRLAGSDARTIDALITVAESATPAERSAIGAGLAQTALACTEVRSDISEYIQLRVGRSDNPQLLTAFLFGTLDFATAAVAGAGPTGAASIGSTGSPPGAHPVESAFPNSGFNFNLRSGGGGFGFTATSNNFFGDPSPTQ